MKIKRSGWATFRLLAAFALAVLPWAAATGIDAAVYVIDSDGHILSVGVGQDPYNPSIQGIEVQDRAPNGQIVSTLLASSLDTTVDRCPVISLRPGGGVAVAWARTEGYDSELALAVRDSSGSWRPHLLLTADTLNDERPKMLVDPAGTAQILWWGNGEGGPIYLQGFDPDTGVARGPRHRPLDPPGSAPGRKTRSSDGTFDGAGGLDDPGVPTTSTRATASAIPCQDNPAAAPDHGLIMSCGRPAAFQLTQCVLTVGVQLDSGTWTQTSTDLRSVNLTLNSTREMIQSLADSYCPQ